MSVLNQACTAVAFCLLASSAVAADRWLYKEGNALDLKSGKPLYVERHREHYRENKLLSRDVEYLCLNGQRFAEKSLKMDEDGSFVPDFFTSDWRSGYHEGVRLANDQRQVFFKRDSASLEESAALPAAEVLVADAGFDVLIGERFNDLLDQQTLLIDFLVPSRLTTIEFRLRQVKLKQSDPSNTVRFQLAPNSAFFRLLVDPLEVNYDRETRRLVSFEGLTNLRDLNGKNYAARIEFPESAQVQVASPNDFPKLASEQLGPKQTCE